MTIPYRKVNVHQYTSIGSRYTQQDNLPETFDGTTVVSKTFSDTFDGNRYPGWRQAKLNGLDVTTVCSGVKQTFQDSYISAHCRLDFGAQKVSRRFVGSLSSAVSDNYWLPIDGTTPSDEIDNRALIGFLKKCKAAQTKLQALVVAGEFRETLHLIKKPASEFRNLVHEYVVACRRISRELSPRLTLLQISRQWLEYSFGMRPLIQDIANAMKAAEKLYFDLPSAYVTHTSKIPYSGHSDTIPFDFYGPYFIPCYMNRLTYRLYGRKLCGGVRLMTTGNRGPLHETIGLTLPDFVPSLYELIPYSFLVDYFTNVGEVLEAMSFNQADLFWHSDTRFEKAVRTVEVVPSHPSTSQGAPVIGYSVSPGLYSQQFSSHSRVSVPLGLPTLTIKIPGNWSKFLNIGALASQRALR
jgi:hypothetical protein